MINTKINELKNESNSKTLNNILEGFKIIHSHICILKVAQIILNEVHPPLTEIFNELYEIFMKKITVDKDIVSVDQIITTHKTILSKFIKIYSDNIYLVIIITVLLNECKYLQNLTIRQKDKCYYYFGKNLYTVSANTMKNLNLTDADCLNFSLVIFVQVLTRINLLTRDTITIYTKNKIKESKYTDYNRIFDNSALLLGHINNDFKPYEDEIKAKKLITDDKYKNLNYIEHFDKKQALIQTLFNNVIPDPLQQANLQVILNKIKAYNEIIGSKIQRKKGFKGFFRPE
jgi:hypothetical protein